VSSGSTSLPEFFYFGRMKKVYAAVIICLLKIDLDAQVKILFDATKAESAANADWVIDADVHNLSWNPNGCTSCGGNESNAQRLPTPTQTAVTSSTPETYWEGSLSAWAIDCVKKGYWVETLPFGTAITYGTTNAQDLSNYNIYVVDEPNILFTSAEKTALMHFILNGGSLFMISDHDGSDRNNDGYDSPAVWNDFITNNGVSNNAFGFKLALENFSGTFTNTVNAPSDSMLHGPFGNVTEVQWANGTSINLFPSQNASVKAVVYRNGVGQADTAALFAYARVGCGKVAVITDSSPEDDGTGDPNDNSLYNGYTSDAAGNHQKLLMNAMVWLAARTCSTPVNSYAARIEPGLIPNPASNEARISSTDEHASVELYNLSGQKLSVETRKSGTDIVVDLTAIPAGLYTCKIYTGGEVFARKLIIAK
jgi:hypothetical protein